MGNRGLNISNLADLVEQLQRRDENIDRRITALIEFLNLEGQDCYEPCEHSHEPEECYALCGHTHPEAATPDITVAGDKSVIVAASNASASWIAAADAADRGFLCDGEADQEELAAALTITLGDEPVYLSPGHFIIDHGTTFVSAGGFIGANPIGHGLTGFGTGFQDTVLEMVAPGSAQSGSALELNLNVVRNIVFGEATPHQVATAYDYLVTFTGVEDTQAVTVTGFGNTAVARFNACRNARMIRVSDDGLGDLGAPLLVIHGNREDGRFENIVLLYNSPGDPPLTLDGGSGANDGLLTLRDVHFFWLNPPPPATYSGTMIDIKGIWVKLDIVGVSLDQADAGKTHSGNLYVVDSAATISNPIRLDPHLHLDRGSYTGTILSNTGSKDVRATRGMLEIPTAERPTAANVVGEFIYNPTTGNVEVAKPGGWSTVV